MKGLLGAFGVIVLGILAAGFYLFRNTDRPRAVTAEPCHSQMVAATSSWERISGGSAGILQVTNLSVKPCALAGRPVVRLVDGSGSALPLSLIESNDGSPQTLAREEYAVAGLIWRNWCGERGDPLRMFIKLPGDTAELEIPMRETGVPLCENASEPSLLRIGSFVGPTERAFPE